MTRISTFCITLVSCAVFSQSYTLEFGYDSAGNEIQRNLVFNSGPIFPGDIPVAEAMAMPSPKDMLQNSIQLSPNPTSGLFYVSWNAAYTMYISTIVIQAYNSSFSQNIPFSNKIAQATLNISTQPAGIYFVKFILTDGSFFTSEIIKL